MFSNIGGKLKMVAKIVCWVGIIGSIIGGIVMIASGNSSMIVSGIAVIIGGAVASWVGSLGMYALGEITENSDIRTNLAVKADMEREQEKKNA